MASLFYTAPTVTSESFDVRVGAQLDEVEISSGAEGSSINRLWGRHRMAGKLIWATNFREEATEVAVGSQTTSGGKGGGGGSSTTYQASTSYSYFCSFAFGLCEGGEGVQLGRIWIDGELIEQGQFTIRFYPGDEAQQPDPWMEAVEGVGNVPAYRGTAYVMFEDMPLANFGNRIPVVTVEVIKPLSARTEDDLEKALQGVCMIPASGEISYATDVHFQDDGYGTSATVNMHNGTGEADAVVSLNQLEAQSENVDSIVLAVAWFGDDLRAGECKVKPKVEFKPVDDYTTASSWTHDLVIRPGQTIRLTNNDGSAYSVAINKDFEEGVSTVASVSLDGGGSAEYTFVEGGNFFTQGPSDTVNFQVTLIQNNRIYPTDWFVNGETRFTADEVSRLPITDDLAYGGTPSDHSIVQYIQEMKSRGIRVIFYPSIMMDQVEGNALPDPYGAAEQPPLPWRGRITCHPAPGEVGTVDKTAAAGTQIDDWFGSAHRTNDFGFDAGGYPVWTGAADEWGYRRMVLHYAHLCELAGGVDGFIIGTELRGITGVRAGASGPFPGVVNLKTLATDVRAIVSGGTDIGYAADWSEYHSYRPDDGTGDVFFNMDTLWSHADIDFIGIDNYLPLSDYREGDTDSIYDLDYLMSHVEGGEYYDYFYASESDRENNVRTDITDDAGKPWVYRQKDIKNWWLNNHVNRPAGTESGGNTTWTPQSKPIWFTEFGCPAVDKGPNQPNVFFDPKSSESAMPHFSNGKRDDLIQRRYAEAFLKYWRPSTGNNPSSTQYSGNMVDFDNTFVWAWDARPYPQFPYLTSTWTDAASYHKGHWHNGRLGAAPLALLVKEICMDYGIAEEDIDVSGLYGTYSVVRGFFTKDLSSGRDLLTSLMEAFMFDGFESEGKIKFILRQNFIEIDIDEGMLVTKKNEPGGFTLTRSQETELPEAVRISFIDEENDYQIATVEGSKQVGSSKDVLEYDLPLVLESGYAQSITDSTLQQAWMQRERAEFSLPSSLIRIDPSDVINTSLNGNPISVAVTQIDSGDIRSLEAKNYDRTVYDTLEYSNTVGSTQTNAVFGFSLLEFMDIPLLTGEESSPHAPRVAAFQNPWPGAVNVYKDNNAGGYNLNTQVPFAAPMGELVSAFYSGPTGIWDINNDLYLQMYSSDQLLSTTDAAVLEGANALAILNKEGEWEILQFVDSELLAPGKYKLSRLLRGQLGSEHAMKDPVPAGSRVVVLNQSTLGVVAMNLNQRLMDIEYRYGPATYQQDDFRYIDQTFNAKGVGLRPYSPVHLKGVRDYSSNDVTFSWVRRTRFGGDNWGVAETPLNEDYEQYEIEVLDGPTVLRTIVVDGTSSWVYTSADQITDFGGVQSSYTFKVYQISALFGRGAVASSTAYF